jgi:hypothetical protein
VNAGLCRLAPVRIRLDEDRLLSVEDLCLENEVLLSTNLCFVGLDEARRRLEKVLVRSNQARVPWTKAGFLRNKALRRTNAVLCLGESAGRLSSTTGCRVTATGSSTSFTRSTAKPGICRQAFCGGGDDLCVGREEMSRAIAIAPGVETVDTRGV